MHRFEVYNGKRGCTADRGSGNVLALACLNFVCHTFAYYRAQGPPRLYGVGQRRAAVIGTNVDATGYGSQFTAIFVGAVEHR